MSIICRPKEKISSKCTSSGVFWMGKSSRVLLLLFLYIYIKKSLTWKLFRSVVWFYLEPLRVPPEEQL